jgi:hypothetical protein
MLIACSTAMAQDASRITAVTLYPGSATVERTARVVPGMTRLEISGPRPTSENWEERQGVVAWTRTIVPNETLKFSVSYAIGYPRETAVAGLP